MSARNPDVLKYFSYLMILVYGALGGYIIFSPTLFDFLAPWQRIFAGIICLAYGIFRFGRIKDRYRDE